MLASDVLNTDFRLSSPLKTPPSDLLFPVSPSLPSTYLHALRTLALLCSYQATSQFLQNVFVMVTNIFISDSVSHSAVPGIGLAASYIHYLIDLVHNLKIRISGLRESVTWLKSHSYSILNFLNLGDLYFYSLGSPFH